MIEKQNFLAYYLTTILVLVLLLCQFSISRVKLKQRHQRRSEFSFVERTSLILKAGYVRGWVGPLHRCIACGEGWGALDIIPLQLAPSHVNRHGADLVRPTSPSVLSQSTLPRKNINTRFLPRKHLTVCVLGVFLHKWFASNDTYSEHERCLQCRGFLGF